MARRRTGGARGAISTTSSDLDDGALLVRVCNDPAAFAELYDRRHAALLRWFLYQTSSHHIAAELTVETFTAALAGVWRYDPGLGTGRAWLYGIAQHQFLRYLRRGEVDQRHRRRMRLTTPTSTADEVERVVEVADAQVQVPELASALATLTPSLRDAVLLRIAADLPYSEVAERLGCSEGAARVRVTRGLRRLVAQMVTP